MENIDRPSADTRTVAGWIRSLPTNFQDAPSVLEVLELHKRFSLWADGDSDLDQRLDNNPTVRKSIVSDLTALLLVLSTGIRLFTPECQRTLVDETNRVLEQASKIAKSHLKHSASCSPLDILGFCNSIKEFKPRIDNLYEILPTTKHLVENFDETEPRQAEEIGVDEGWSVSSIHIKRVRRRIAQTFKQLRSTITPASKSSSTSHGAKNSRKPHSNPSKSSTKKSYGSTDPSSISPIFSDSCTHDSANPPTDTVTSDSPSEVEKSSSKPITSISTRASSSCKKCSTTFSDPAGMENHSCPSYKMAYLRDRFVSRPSARMSHGMVLNSEEFVKIWHRSGQFHKNSNIVLIDSGSVESFICRSVVEELELEITRIAPTTLTALSNHVFTVRERVQPTWQFHRGSRLHQEFSFFVVSEIPGERDMLLGNIAMIDLGIELRVSGALTAHEDYNGHSTLAQQQQLRERQRRDTTARQAKTRHDLEARHVQMVRIRAAANAATKVKQSNPTSQKDATRSDNSKG